MPSISFKVDKYFLNLDVTLRDFLTTQIFKSNVIKWLNHFVICYDMTLINDCLPLLEVRIGCMVLKLGINNWILKLDDYYLQFHWILYFLDNR